MDPTALAARGNGAMVRQLRAIFNTISRAAGLATAEWTLVATAPIPEPPEEPPAFVAPTSGQIKFDVTDPAEAEHLYLANQTVNGVDLASILGVLLKVGQRVYIQDKDDAAVYAVYTITVITAETDYYDLTVTPGTAAGVLPYDRVLVSVLPAA